MKFIINKLKVMEKDKLYDTWEVVRESDGEKVN